MVGIAVATIEMSIAAMKIAIITAASTNRRADWSSADGRSSRFCRTVG